MAQRISLAVIAAAPLLCCAPAPTPAPGGYLGYGHPDSSGVITFRDEMGTTFKLVKISFTLDDESIFLCDQGDRLLDASKGVRVYDGPLASGGHELGADLMYKGFGYGVFSYLKSYSFKVRSTHELSVEPGERLALDAIAYERGGATTPMEDRPQVRFEEHDGRDVPQGPRDVCPWSAEPPPEGDVKSSASPSRGALASTPRASRP